jgi:Mg2+-importing ATPase
LALAYKEIKYAKGFDILENEQDLIFLGYLSLLDPLRTTAKNTIAHAEALGIKVKILTGDSREVAEYVGKEIGLVKAGGKVYIGDELEALPAAEFKKAVLACDVFARVSPTQKFNIIKALKESYVVAYQGDGINDAPALKLADVAIAVNSATDIAKENADVVLLNKSLEVIINGIKDGRAIFININKYIKFTMISNFGNFITLSILYLISSTLPILAIQILLIAILTDLPAIAISTDSVEDSEVVRPEKHNVRELILIALLLGIPTALFELFYFLMVRSATQPFLQTKLYIFFTLLGLVSLYIVRNKAHFWKAKRPSLALNISFIAVAVISVALIYIPIFKNWFSFASLSAVTIAAILALVAVYFLITDYVKVWYYRTLGKEV